VSPADAENFWSDPPESVAPSPDQLDVWRLRLSLHRELLQQFEPMLDDSQRQRASEFRFPELRERYILRHGLLRLVLACYVQRLPGEIRFEIGAHGKPRLTPEFGAVHFNLSDSGDLAVIAVAGAEVGIDVEQVNQRQPPLEIVPQLHESERLAVETSDLLRRAEVLYQIWVRKEAYLKCRGEGIGVVQLHKFAVPCADSAGKSLWQIPIEDGAFHGCDFVAAQNALACVVSRKSIGALRLFDASPSWAQRTLRSFERHKYLLALAR
jgi:4'-phosphopantetheinyl transferase